jgi:hypothetical protein
MRSQVELMSLKSVTVYAWRGDAQKRHIEGILNILQLKKSSGVIQSITPVTVHSAKEKDLTHLIS